MDFKMDFQYLKNNHQIVKIKFTFKLGLKALRSLYV